MTSAGQTPTVLLMLQIVLIAKRDSKLTQSGLLVVSIVTVNSYTGCSETRVQILNGSQNLTNESNVLIFVLNCRQIITFYNT